MPRGPKKHLKRLAAPKSWMLDKLGGVFTIKPSAGPHKSSESLPVTLFLRYSPPEGHSSLRNFTAFSNFLPRNKNCSLVYILFE